MRYDVTAPAKGFSGDVAGVVFSKGHAVVDEDTHARALAYFRRKGYTVVQAETDVSEVPADPSVRPARGASKADWVAYARTRAQDEDEEAAVEGLTKEQLVAQYGGDGDG
jgi:hypothetical protein